MQGEGFSGSIGAEEAHHLAGLNLEGEAADEYVTGNAHVDAASLKQWTGIPVQG